MAKLTDMGERYTILEALGSGGFGSVYKAHDTMLDRDVALKRLYKSLGEDELRAQLLREARVLATMQHPNIVAIYDISSMADSDDIVMELLQGVSLDKLVKRHLLQMSDFKNVACQILQALASAHAAGVLHCDVKPENIMLCLASEDHYEAKIYDFGMSPTPGEQGKTTKLLGSIYVMAPELFNGGQPSAQSDLYALGCVLYYLLAGEYPFLGDSSVQVMASHITGNYVPVSEYRPDLSHELCSWLDSMLQKDTAERFESCKKALSGLAAIELKEKEAEFTLPTALKLEGKNSRLVRNISVESVTTGQVTELSNTTTVFLSNTYSHSSPVGEKPALPARAIKKAKSPIDTAEEQMLPDGAEWYFTIGDGIKGPVSLEQLNKLCHEDKVTEATLVWHALLGDWVTAAICAETKAVFDTKKQIIHIQEVEKAAADEAEANEAARNEVTSNEATKVQVISGFGLEVWLVFSATIPTIILSIIYPDILHYIMAIYLLVILAVGLSAARVYQMRQGAKWFCAIPVIGDLYHAITRPNARNTLCAVMVIVGSIGMVIMGCGEAKAIEYRHSMAQADSDRLDYAYLKIKELSKTLVVSDLPTPAVVDDTTPVVVVEAVPTPVVVESGDSKPTSEPIEKPKGREFSSDKKRGIRNFSDRLKNQ
jgi:serine/threonine protein kinase